jgi:hypothetical protein
MEERLLSRDKQGTHTAERALLEGFWRIVEPTAEVGLAAMTGCIDDRVDVDPTAALSDQFDTDRSPVSLQAVSPARQNVQRHCLLAGVHRQVKVTVQSGLPTNQSIGTRHPRGRTPGHRATQRSSGSVDHRVSPLQQHFGHSPLGYKDPWSNSAGWQNSSAGWPSWVERSGLASFPLVVRCGRPTSSRSGGAPPTAEVTHP